MELSCRGQWTLSEAIVIVLKSSVYQMVYKHAISTVVPSTNVKIEQDSVIEFAIIIHDKSLTNYSDSGSGN